LRVIDADRISIANLKCRLNSRRKVRAIMTENRCASSKLRNPRWRSDIGPKLVVKTPTSDGLAQQENFRGIIRIGNLDKNAFEEVQTVRDALPAFFGSCSYCGSRTINQDSLRLANRAVPDALALNFGIQRKG